MKTRYKHINFQTRLDVWHCIANRGGDVLGFLEWNKRWQQFEFVPYPDTGFSQDCLLDIVDFIKQLPKRTANGAEKPLSKSGMCCRNSSEACNRCLACCG